MSRGVERARVAMLSPVAPTHGRGGVQDIVGSLATGLARKGCDVLLITSEHAERKVREQVEGIEIHYLPIAARSMALTGAGAAWMAASREKVRQLHAERALDVIHSQSFCGIHLAGALPGVPVIATLHGTHVDELRTRAGLMKASWPRAPIATARLGVLWLLMFSRLLREGPRVRRLDAVIATSREQHALLAERYGVPKSKLHDVWNGVDQDRFSPTEPGAAERSALGVAAGDPIVLAVARLFREKGIHYLLDAWPALRASHPTARLIIVGDGPERVALEARTRSLGEAGVRFMGTVPLESLPALYAAADVFVNPTVRVNGYDLTILQAMAMARPVVVSNIGSVPTAVEDGTDGFLVPPADPSALAAAILRVLDDPVASAAVGARARSTVERRFSLDSMVTGTLAVYERVIAAKRGGVAAV
jgi:glycosyltransferase involved in cell wall biosynthesis